MQKLLERKFALKVPVQEKVVRGEYKALMMVEEVLKGNNQVDVDLRVTRAAIIAMLLATGACPGLLFPARTTRTIT